MTKPGQQLDEQHAALAAKVVSLQAEQTELGKILGNVLVRLGELEDRPHPTSSPQPEPEPEPTPTGYIISGPDWQGVEVKR